MIPFFGVGITNDSQAFAFLNAQGNSYLLRRNENINPIQVEAQVPYWMTKNSDGYGNSSVMINFLQEYYNWLTNHYGYENTNVFDVTKLFDINASPSFMLEHFVNTFAQDISTIYKLPDSKRPTSDQIRNTIVNIRTEIYEEKSTETVFKRLLNSLFGINPNEVTIKYPKTRLMRLNGGILPWMSNGMNESISQFIGSTGEYSNERYSLIGSYLNQGVIYDNNLWQEYSYVVDSPIDESDVYYEETVRNTLHPAGFKAFFEKRELFAEVAPPDINLESDYEVPVVANYYPYNLSMNTSLAKCTGCTTGSPLFVAGWTYPTFVFPSWDVEIQRRGYTSFGSILLHDFFELNSVKGASSPNDFIGTSCDLACGATGSADFSWYIVVGGQGVIVPNIYTPEPGTEINIPGDDVALS